MSRKKPARELPKLMLPMIAEIRDTGRRDAGGFIEHEYIEAEVECEVLTLNINAGTMRVRYMADPWKTGKLKPDTRDVPNDPFFEKYEFAEL